MRTASVYGRDEIVSKYDEYTAKQLLLRLFIIHRYTYLEDQIAGDFDW